MPSWRAVDVRHRQPDDLRRERAHAFLEQAVLAGQAERQQRAAVVAALEADDAGPPRVGARGLHRVLHRLGAAVGEQRLLGERAGRHLVEQLAQPHVRLVGADQRAHVDELLRLVVHRLDDGRRAVADGERADAADEVDEGVAVDVVHERALGAFHDDLGGLPEAVRHRRRRAAPAPPGCAGPGSSVFS